MTPVLLTLAEAAERARRHPQTVRTWCHEKGLRHQQQPPNGPIRIWEVDLYEYLGLPTEGDTTGDLTGANAPQRTSIARPARSPESG